MAGSRSTVLALIDLDRSGRESLTQQIYARVRELIVCGRVAPGAQIPSTRALASELGVILLLNLGITFGVPGISIGGHLGGVVGGVICALFIVAGERGNLGPNPKAAEILAMAAIAIFSIAAAIEVA